MAHSTAHTDSAAHLVLSLSCPDRPGIVHAVTGTLARRGGNITESKQFGDSSTGLFFMRVQVLTTVPREELEKDLAELAGEYEMEWSLDEVGRAMRTLIMVSKEGHCLTDLLFRARSQGLPVDVVGVVGNHETLRDVAEFYGVPSTTSRSPRRPRRPPRPSCWGWWTHSTSSWWCWPATCRSSPPPCASGCTGASSTSTTRSLPSFKGARPYAQAHERGVKLIGATAHYVTADLDEGPIIEQDVTRAGHEDSVSMLQAKGQDVERRVLAQAVRWHTEHRVLLNGHRTVVFA